MLGNDGLVRGSSVTNVKKLTTCFQPIKSNFQNFSEWKLVQKITNATLHFGSFIKNPRKHKNSMIKAP